MKIQKFKGSKVVYADDCIKLHKFSSGGSKVFVVPPHAGRHGNITQNLIDRLVVEDKEVYAYELLPAIYKTRNLDVAELIRKLAHCAKLIGTDPIDLLGVCQGGWLSAGLTSLHPQLVNRLALFATPINMKTGEDNAIEHYCKLPGVMAWHRLAVMMNGGIQLGVMQWMAFAMANPVPVFLTRYADRMRYSLEGNDAALAKWDKEQDWYDYSIDLHGGWFLEAMENHFIGNKLWDGTWTLSDGQVPNLSNIDCPLFVYAGGDDPITHPKQALGIADRVSSTEIHTHTFPGAGHTAPFVRGACIDYFIREFYT